MLTESDRRAMVMLALSTGIVLTMVVLVVYFGLVLING